MNTIGLVEEYLLLTLEDDGGEFDSAREIFVDCGLAGAVLMDLAIRNKIDSDLESLWVIDDSPTGVEILDGVLDQISKSTERLSAKVWIARLSKQAQSLRKTTIKSLCERGIIHQKDHKYLWVLKERRYPIIEGQQRTEAKKRLFALLYNDDIPTPIDVSLAGLADASFLFERFFTSRELIKLKPRIDQLVRMDLIGGEIARVAHETNIQIQKAERRTIIAGLAGNVVEWYDFGVYGFFAATIGKQFFPAKDPTLSLLASFGVFAIGFIARPLGGLVFGHVGDKFGRRAAVLISVLLMIVPTFLMALLPTYEKIGIIAPILLILLRLAQGLAVGGEYTTSMVLLVEEARPSRRGFVGSFAPFGALGGLLLGSGVGAFLTSQLSPENAASWGWRLAFFTGLIIGLIVFLIRRRLPPDEEILAREEARASPLKDAFREEWKTIIKVLGFSLRATVGFYLCFVYLSTWLTQNTEISTSTALILNSIALALMMILTPLSGALSDRIGRKTVLVIGATASTILVWPLFSLMTTPSVSYILVGQCAFALLMSTSGAGPAFMVEAFPKHVRCSGLSVGYNIATAIFGGTVPLVSTFLVKVTKYPLAPAIYFAVISIVSLYATIMMDSHEDEGE